MTDEHEDRSAGEEPPADLDPGGEADDVRGGATPVGSNVLKRMDDVAKTTINNMR